MVKNLGGIPVLKFLQRLALDFRKYLSVIFPGLSYRQMYRKFLKVVLSLLVRVTPSNFFSRILRIPKMYVLERAERSFGLQIIFLSEQPFYGNYSTLDSHTNTVIFLRVCLLVKTESKSVTGFMMTMG